MQKKIIIAEDHRILREGLKALLSSNPDYDVAGEAENGIDAIKCVDKIKPDLALLDLSMPKMNGTDAIKEIKKRHPKIKILVLTVHNAEEYIFASLQAGADGYVLKDASSSELMTAIQHTLHGETYLSPEVSKKVINKYLKSNKRTPSRSSLGALTQREREILKLIAEGNKNKTISDYLCISLKTVETHRNRLMKKLDLHCAADLTAYAIEKGIVSIK